MIYKSLNSSCGQKSVLFRQNSLPTTVEPGKHRPSRHLTTAKYVNSEWTGALFKGLFREQNRKDQLHYYWHQKWRKPRQQESSRVGRRRSLVQIVNNFKNTQFAVLNICKIQNKTFSPLQAMSTTYKYKNIVADLLVGWINFWIRQYVCDISYGSVSAGRVTWPFCVIFFFKLSLCVAKPKKIRLDSSIDHGQLCR